MKELRITLTCQTMVWLFGLWFIMAGNASAFVGSESCAGCHESEYADWRSSHHFSAMAEASNETVLGDFDDSSFTYNGITSRFYKKDGRFFVLTDNAEGELQEFEVSYTFGFYPLQQYLVDFPDGRKQVLGIIWDSRSAEEGGQRWYHLYPEHDTLNHGEPSRAVDSDDPLHWTGTYFNWNSRCASCHSTDLQKGYDSERDRYDTTWAEISIGCESCHGPAEDHLARVRQQGEPHEVAAYRGSAMSLQPRNVWAAIQGLADDETADKPAGEATNTAENVCAACHSRRSELEQTDPRNDYHDAYSLTLLEAPFYYADGQIRDEVYVWGSFLQSKMHGEGVTCSNCHNSHSLELRVEGNGLCVQCHTAQDFDTPRHHHHAPDSEGAQCVNCHMPATTYMGIDARRDHSLRIPRPEQSASIGAPNACNQCHQDQGAAWAQRSIEEWLAGSGDELGRHPFADAFYAADNGKPEAAPRLLEIATDDSMPAIARGSAILRHAPYHNQSSLKVLQQLLKDDEILVRLGALRSMETLPLNVRYHLLAPHLDETVMSLRIEIARLLSGIPLEQIEPDMANQLSGLYRDFHETADYNADMPDPQVVVGQFHASNQDYEAAEEAYKKTLTLAPQHEGALLNLADLYRQIGKDTEGKALLERAVEAAPESATSHYALGLYFIRQKRYDQAAIELKAAADLALSSPRYAYAYALALENLGEEEEAIAYLEEWKEREGPRPQIDKTLQRLKEDSR